MIPDLRPNKGLIILLLAVMFKSSAAQEVIFLHHSIGGNLFEYGNVASWFNDYNQTNGKSFHVVERSYPDTPWPWANYAYDYWKLWIDGGCDSNDPDIECLNTLAAKYNMIIFKHCAPGSTILPNTGQPDITSGIQTIENYQLQYRALRSLFDSYPDTRFMVWTLAPLHRLSTNVDVAQRAYEFVQWVKNEWLTEDGKSHPNICIFDFFSLVAELDQNPVNGVRYCLKYDYEGSHTDADSHPNMAANQYAGPLFARAIVDAFAEKSVQVTTINVIAAGGTSTISSNGGTLQLSAGILPDDATNDSVTWSIQNGTGEASINPAGLVTALGNGTVIATATATDGSEVSGNLVITISGQIVSVSGITVTGAGGSDTIDTLYGTLQLSADIMPADATARTVIWSIQNGTGEATINPSGLVTALSNGTVTAFAAATDSSGVTGSLTLTISGQRIAVTGITVTGATGENVISIPGGTLQLIVTLLPSDATNNKVDWSIENGTGQAFISTDGLVTAISDGTVIATAAATDGSGVSGTVIISITGQQIPTTLVVNEIDQPGITFDDQKLTVHLIENNVNPTLSFYNMLGNLIISRTAVNNTCVINVSSLPAGIYILVISDERNSAIFKMAKP